MSIFKRARRFMPLRVDVAEPTSMRGLSPIPDLPTGYFPTNPSFAEIPGGLMICVRGVNYVPGARGATPTFTSGHTYHSVNRVWVEWDSGAVEPLTNVTEMLDGAEDIRLLHYDNVVYMIYSQPSDTKNDENRSSMVLATLDLQQMLFKRISFASPFGFFQEKNWSPFIHNGLLKFVYSFDPLLVLSIDDQEGKVIFTQPDDAQQLKSKLNFLTGGSGAGVPWRNAHLFVTHRRVVRLPTSDRVYVHRFALLSSNLVDVDFGPYFSVGPEEIQIVGATRLAPDEVQLALGSRDNAAFLVGFEKEQFVDRFFPRSR